MIGGVSDPPLSSFDFQGFLFLSVQTRDLNCSTSIKGLTFQVDDKDQVQAIYFVWIWFVSSCCFKIKILSIYNANIYLSFR